MTSIAFLADHPEHLRTLAEWFRAEWETYYAGRTTEDVAQELSEDLNRDRIPIRLVAFVDDALAGCIVLRQEVVPGQPQYSPGLGGLFVHPSKREQGVGTELVKAGMQLAHHLAIPVIYTTTNSARHIVERLGWEHLGTVNNHGEAVILYRYTTGKLTL